MAPTSLGMEIKYGIAINITAVMLVHGCTLFWCVILIPLTRDDDDLDAHAHQTGINIMPVTMANFGGNEIPMPKWSTLCRHHGGGVLGRSGGRSSLKFQRRKNQ